MPFSFIFDFTELSLQKFVHLYYDQLSLWLIISTEACVFVSNFESLCVILKFKQQTWVLCVLAIV